MKESLTLRIVETDDPTFLAEDLSSDEGSEETKAPRVRQADMDVQRNINKLLISKNEAKSSDLTTLSRFNKGLVHENQRFQAFFNETARTEAYRSVKTVVNKNDNIRKAYIVPYQLQPGFR
jgi:hypothetical protein